MSSAIFVSPDRTMEEMLEVLRLLRREYNFHGYIHLKAIPGCSPELLTEGAQLADRMSANIELPSRDSLELLAPDKKEQDILEVFSQTGLRENAPKKRRLPTKSNSIGMSTQMIIGASPEDDRTIIRRAGGLYRIPQLKRVYYSAYIPVNEDSRLPGLGGGPPLVREHRLYQADWLLRFYHFDVEEILAADQHYLDPELDPKTAWALRHPELFPVDINRADQKTLLRIPGLGIRSCRRILKARRHSHLKIAELDKLGVVMKRARYFLSDGYRGPKRDLPSEQLRQLLVRPASRQLAFDFSVTAPSLSSALSGEL